MFTQTQVPAKPFTRTVDAIRLEYAYYGYCLTSARQMPIYDPRGTRHEYRRTGFHGGTVCYFDSKAEMEADLANIRMIRRWESE